MLQVSNPASLLKKRLPHICFLVNFAKFSGTPFLQNTFVYCFFPSVSLTTSIHLLTNKNETELMKYFFLQIIYHHLFRKHQNFLKTSLKLQFMFVMKLPTFFTICIKACVIFSILKHRQYLY